MRKIIFFVCLCVFGVRAANWADVQTKVKNSVIQVFSAVVEFNWSQPFRTKAHGEARGTGFFIDERGYFITNAHVVSQACAITIQIPDFSRERMDVSIVGVSYDRDIALLKVSDGALAKINQKLGRVPTVSLGCSNSVRRGQEVMALGYPLGHEYLKSTVGVVCGRESVGTDGASYERQCIQIDAPINPGNSGGPTLNKDGQVIGINTAGVPSAQNIGYIIPINELKIILPDLYNLESSQNKILRKPCLGADCRLASPELNTFLGNPPGGVYVASLHKDSPLYQAGLRKGDILYSINDIIIDNYNQLTVPWCEDKISLDNYYAYLKPSEPVKFVFYRTGQRQEVSVPFEQKFLPSVRIMYPEFEKIEYEIIGGLVIMQLTANHILNWRKDLPELVKYVQGKDQYKSFLVVTHVLPGSAAHLSRVLSTGELIKSVNGQKVSTIAQLREILLKDVNSLFLRVQLIDGTLAVFNLNQVLAQERELSSVYHYIPTHAVQELIKMRQEKL